MLRLLGTAHVIGEGGDLTDLPEKAFILMGLLALEDGGPIARERLRALLWEEAGAQASADNLRWLLSRIRRWQRRHGLCVLDIRRASVSLMGGVTADVMELMRTRSVETAAQLDALLDTWRGELLEGVATDLGTELDEVLGAARQRTRRHFVALAREAALRVPGERGERILRDLIAEEGDDESLLRTLLARLARDRGAPAARTEYESAAARLRRDYDIEPGLETRALIAQLAPATVSAATYTALAPEVVESGIPRIVLLPPAFPFPVDPQTRTVADAMVEDVSLQLCRMRTFAMFAPHTARQVAGLDAAAAMAPFGVGYVARTMLLPNRENSLRLGLSVVRAATGAIVLADQFEFDEARLGSGFTELAEAIASQLAGAVEHVEIAGYRRTGAASAYVLYLLGMKVLDNLHLPSLRRARRSFARALELEPGYVPAMTGMARTLSRELLALRRPESDLAKRAMALASEAAQIDPLDPNAWREMAAASLYLHDVDASLEYLDGALSRARHHADIIAEKGEVLVHASRPQEARQHMLEAMDLNPLAPDDYHWTLGSAEFFLGRYPEALTALRRMRNSDSASRLIAAAAAMAGDLRTAARYRERWMQIYPDSSTANFAQFMPHTSKADVAHYLDALRRAGFT